MSGGRRGGGGGGGEEADFCGTPSSRFVFNVEPHAWSLKKDLITCSLL